MHSVGDSSMFCCNLWYRTVSCTLISLLSHATKVCFQQLHQYEKQSHVFQDQENSPLWPLQMADADITWGFLMDHNVGGWLGANSWGLIVGGLTWLNHL